MLQNLETEQTLIGLALTDRDCAEQLASLPVDSFYFPETTVLFRIIRDIIKERGTPNLVSVGSKIPGAAVNVMECSRRCMEMGIAPTLYRQLEAELLDFRKRRILLKACESVAQKAADPLADVDQMMGELTKAVNDNADKLDSVDMADAVMEWMDDLGDQNCMISTGIAGIDRITGGLQNGMLAILGARPKVGKTALGLSIATNVARKAGPVLIASLEMTRKEIMTRMMAAETGTDMQHYVTKNLSDEELEKVGAAASELAKLDIRIVNKQTPTQIRRFAADMQRNGGLAMIMIDYIQLMKADESRKSRYEEVSSISRELKLMAMELNVPILALTQFNRDSEQGGKSRKPSMAEARDSGSIEQDANIFIIQYAPDEPKQGSELHDYWEVCQQRGCEFQILEIAANRQGPTGNVMTMFDKSHMRFTTLTAG